MNAGFTKRGQILKTWLKQFSYLSGLTLLRASRENKMKNKCAGNWNFLLATVCFSPQGGALYCTIKRQERADAEDVTEWRQHVRVSLHMETWNNTIKSQSQTILQHFSHCNKHALGYSHWHETATHEHCCKPNFLSFHKWEGLNCFSSANFKKLEQMLIIFIDMWCYNHNDSVAYKQCTLV